MSIPLPPTRAEQEAIAGALSDADALISSLETLITKKCHIKQGAMQQLLTGKKRLSGFQKKEEYKQTEVGVIPENWKAVNLDKLVVPNGLVRGPFGGALKKEFFVRDGYSVYEQRHAIHGIHTSARYFIDANKYNELIRFAIDAGDLIVSCSGTIGKIQLIPDNVPAGVINQALLKITLNEKIDTNFFISVFRSTRFQEKITDSSHGGAMPNLVGMADFKKTKFPLPALCEQEAIAKTLSDMDTEITALETKLAKTCQLKQGMMAELLTGRIRLI